MDISNEEKVRIARDFIRAAPAGEFREVVNDVRVLLGDDALLTTASDVFYEHATEQFCRVDVEGSPALVTKEGSVDGSKVFYDPGTDKNFTYKYLTGEATNIEPGTRDNGAESWRKALEDALAVYLKDNFPAFGSAVYGKLDGDTVSLTVAIENHKYNPDNFYCGKWQSKWNVEFPTSGGFAKVTGELKVQVHYFEDGNVQLHTKKTTEESIQVSNPEEGAKNVVEFIGRSEKEYQLGINENYREMSATTFKSLRRALPITKNLVDWHKLHSLNIGRDLMNRTT